MSRRRPRAETWLDYLYKLDYKEKPVDVIKFIEDPYYLGKATGRGRTIYPAWKKALADVFDDDSKFLVVFTGAIGTGKTTAAIIGIAYVLHLLLCLRDPWAYFNKASAGKMSISFFNLTKSLGDSRGFGKLQSFLVQSPWFRKKAIGMPKLKSGQPYLEFALFEYTLSSPYARGFGTVGQDVVVGIMDEVDSPTESVKQKERVFKAYEATVRRFESRFVIDGHSLGRLFLVASKQGELSFIEAFIAKMKSSNKVKIFDIPLWDAQPKTYYSGEKFYVAVGDAFYVPRIIDEKDREKYIKDGYRIIAVPVEFRDEFERDLIGSLRDLAGVTVSGIRKYKLFASEKFVKECFDETKPNPIEVETVEIGLEDDVELIWYIDVSKFRMPKSVPRYLHWDISFSGDASGVSMCGVAGWKVVDVEKEDGTFRKERLPIIETDFVLRVKAREGDRIPLHKVRKLILDLRALGYMIKVSADLKLASEDTSQILKKAGMDVKYVSVDRTDKPYVNWRNLVYEKRWVMHPHPRVLFEAKHLEHDLERGKVDHPEEVRDIEFLEDGAIKEVVMEGTKDLTDAIVGAIENCLSDVKPPMDVEGMRKVMDVVTSKEVSQSKKGMIPFKDRSGKDIIGVKQGDQLKKLSDIFKKLRG